MSPFQLLDYHTILPLFSSKEGFIFFRLSAVLTFSVIKLISEAITFRITRFPISRLIGSKCLAALLPASLQHFANGSFPSMGITYWLLGVLLLHCNFRWSGSNNKCSLYGRLYCQIKWSNKGIRVTFHSQACCQGFQSKTKQTCKLLDRSPVSTLFMSLFYCTCTPKPQ